MAVLRRTCPHCSTEKVAFYIEWVAASTNRNGIFNCLAICGACGKPICFEAAIVNYAGSPKDLPGIIEPAFKVPMIWPPELPLAAPPHTPTPVAKRYLEGEDAYRRKNWNSAVAMYRSALDIGTKGIQGVPLGKTFFERLKWMDENHTITPDIRSWADHVRVEGNNALHDPDEFTEVDATALRLFTEMFLRYVFELPGEVTKFREAQKSG